MMGEPGEAAKFDLAPNEGNLLASETADDIRKILSRIAHGATDWNPLAEALEVDEPLIDDLQARKQGPYHMIRLLGLLDSDDTVKAIEIWPE
ncbi:hypothetical protein FNAPI_2238 [Fusarium napiforme]|uniref:Uncharacterized protein n=1 Tax=Fusarium napiforme TaxID=42672 RepID=A0A8H5K225_9HYPO|nr:hypothetical protein FNAPI_2238 [Fusarium napiforme]